ncbi:MAG: heavy metal-responsive transcriptional regulator [Scytolyngbya sp. HA4215-MV1]|jgi:DNA-binding transcriptional MerR regulator|nr:heavy metal-responsive transcriptional regulator [Scytolyngbya sp. HA4215-MV1]
MLVQETPRLIGAIAKESHIPVKTIRYYEELGLLQSTRRTEGGFRLFPPDTISRLSFIKRAQSLGLSLSEIKEFLDIYDRGNLPCDHVKVKLNNKIAEIDQQLQQLQILKQELIGLLSGSTTVSKTSPQLICPIIQHTIKA